MPEEVSGFRTYVPGDVSLMSRDIGHTVPAVVVEAEPVRARV
jgi:hypothetical protein